MGGSKTQRTLFTDERIAAMRDNVEQHPWARKILDGFLAIADTHVDDSDEELASTLPDPRIPRSISVHETGCPNCGLECRKFGPYPWLINKQRPFKVECPNCQGVFPSNDFQAYLDSGMKDRSLLTGDNPDDGFGWASPQDPGHNYWFVGYYAQWIVHKKVYTIIDGFYHAYLATGDDRYARKCAVMLWQLAMYYPEYDYAKQSRVGLEFDPDYNGKLLYHTWECWTVDRAVLAYDAIFPEMI